MGLKGRLASLQKAMRGKLDYFELADGTRYYFEPEKAWITLFRFWSASLRAAHRGNPRPEPPGRPEGRGGRQRPAQGPRSGLPAAARRAVDTGRRRGARRARRVRAAPPRGTSTSRGAGDGRLLGPARPDRRPVRYGRGCPRPKGEGAVRCRPSEPRPYSRVAEKGNSR